MSKIVDFYRGEDTDVENRLLSEMHGYSDDKMEASHTFIQWMFPLHEKSYHAVNSPVLTKNDVKEIQSSQLIKQNMRISLVHFLKFLGYSEDVDQKKIQWWANTGNHNLLRITRVIRSLRLFGLEDEAYRFYKMMDKVASERGISNTTRDFWKLAAEGEILSSITDKFLELRRV